MTRIRIFILSWRDVLVASPVNEQFKYSEVTEKIIGTFYKVYNELGFGFLESVYENLLAIALKEKGLEVYQQISVPVSFRGNIVGDFEADVLVERCIFLELKAV